MRYSEIKEASANPIDYLVDNKDKFLLNIAPHAEESSIQYLLPDYEGDEDGLLSAYFDHCMETFYFIQSRGIIDVCRMISVDDINSFLVATENGAKLGHHWTYNESSASVGYHDQAPKAHVIILFGVAPASSINWMKSLTSHFTHPDENELYLDGPVKLESIVDEQSGKTISSPNMNTIA
jgi:hypothetical protein